MERLLLVEPNLLFRDGLALLLGQGGRDRLNARDGNRGDLLKGGGRDQCAKYKRDRARSC